MENLLHQSSLMKIVGRLKYTLTRFVRAEDIRNKVVLDIGCGFGWFERNALNSGVKSITGIEISQKNLEASRRIIDPRANFCIGNALDLPFKDNSFNTVVAWEVLEHIPKNTERIMFSEVVRVLKPGGRFLLSTPNLNLAYCLFDPAWWLTGHRHYAVGFLRELAMKHRFKVEKVVIRGGWIELIYMINLYVSKWIFHRPPFFEKKLTLLLDKEYLKRGFTTIFCSLRKYM